MEETNKNTEETQNAQAEQPKVEEKKVEEAKTDRELKSEGVALADLSGHMQMDNAQKEELLK